MNSLLRLAFKSSKCNAFTQSKHLPIRQYSISYSRRWINQNVRFGGTAVPTVFPRHKLPTSFLIPSRTFAKRRNGAEHNDFDEDDDDDDFDADSEPNLSESFLPATVAVPEVWPHLPVIAINKNPIYPRFMRIIEVIPNIRIRFVSKLICFFLVRFR